MGSLSENFIRGIQSIYRHLPPYLELDGEQITGVLNSYGDFWRRRYPDDQKLEWEMIERTADGFWALYFSDGRTAYITALEIVPTPKIKDGLDWLFENIHAHGIRQIIFGGIRDPFGLGWSGLAPALQPVIDVLIRDFKYQIEEQWAVYVFSDLQSIDRHRSEQFGEFSLHFQENPEQGEWDVSATLDTAEAGSCQAWAIPDYLLTMASGKKWGTIEWIGVEPPFQRKGLGRALLTQQLIWQQRLGIDRVGLWTETDNLRAGALVESSGYKKIGIVKNLKNFPASGTGKLSYVEFA